MSKRTRRERRAHQQERAAAEGDVATLEQLAERSPRAAVAALVRALGAPRAEAAQAGELDALALRTCLKLRRAGEAAAALAVAAAGGRRTPGMRMEEALAAFGSGDDARAAEIAAGDDAVAAAIGPLLQAVRGEVDGRLPARADAPLRALHAAARAAAHAVRGEVDQARDAVRRIPMPRRAAVAAGGILAAASLAEPGGAIDALRALGASPDVRADAGLRRLAVSEAALAAGDLERVPGAFAAEPEIARRLVPALFGEATSPGTRAAIIRRVGVDVFDPPERGAAALYVGFTQIQAEPEAAVRSFDRAIQLGGDLIEALRGKMLAALALASGEGAAARRAGREAAAAADRLAHALERRADGGPLAAAAGRVAAMRWVAAGDARAAQASIARARPLAGGKLVEALDLLEVDALAIRDPKQAERHLDALLAQAPASVAVWKAKAGLAYAQGDVARGHRVLVDAAEATKDPALVTEAREIRGDLGQIAPFEGLVPGVATAGALAKELARTTTEEEDPLPLAAACRDALGHAARLAFDAAAVVIAACDGTDAMAEAHLRAALLAHRGAPGDLARLVGAALFTGAVEVVLRAARALDDDARALQAIAEALAVAGYGRAAGKLLPRFAAGLTRERVAFFKGLARAERQVEIAGVPDPEQAARELDLALAPDLSLADYVEERDEGDDDDAFPLGLPGEGGILRDLLETLGGPAGAVDAIPAKKLMDLELRLVAIAARGMGPETTQEIADILHEIGIPARIRPETRRKR